MSHLQSKWTLNRYNPNTTTTAVHLHPECFGSKLNLLPIKECFAEQEVSSSSKKYPTNRKRGMFTESSRHIENLLLFFSRRPEKGEDRVHGNLYGKEKISQDYFPFSPQVTFRIGFPLRAGGAK